MRRRITVEGGPFARGLSPSLGLAKGSPSGAEHSLKWKSAAVRIASLICHK